MAPRPQIEFRLHAENTHEIEPRRIPELKFFKVRAQPILQTIGPKDLLELPHDDRRFVIDDGAVQAPRFVEIRQLLANRMGAGRSIYGVGGRIVGDEKPQIMIYVRKRRVHDFGRHELGQHFFHPDIVEPLHRDQVAEPHMRRFVRDGLRAIEHLGLGCRFVEEDPRLVIEDGARVFHAAELK